VHSNNVEIKRQAFFRKKWSHRCPPIVRYYNVVKIVCQSWPLVSSLFLLLMAAASGT
jgi:hypothetical protein